MNLKAFRFSLVYCSILFTLSACVNMPTTSTYTNNKRQTIAKKLEATGQYYDALTQWKIAKLMHPDAANIDKQIARLESFISKEVKSLQAIASQTPSNARPPGEASIYLKILSLEPSNQLALSKLREIEKTTAINHTETKSEPKKPRRRQIATADKKADELDVFIKEISKRKESKNYKGIIELSNSYLDQYPENEQALKFQFNALQSLAEIQVSNSNPEQAIVLLTQALHINGMNYKYVEKQLVTLKNKLSNDYTKEGMKLFKNNLEKAIEMFQLSLKHNPQNARASQQLKLANKVKSNLEKIKALAN